MRINDLLVENKQVVSERPMGFIKQGLNKLGAKFLPGSFGAKAQGRLNTGTVANKLYKDFATYIGQTGYENNSDAVKSFLQSQGADKEIDVDAIVGAPGTPLNRAGLNKVFMDVAQGLARASGGVPASSKGSSDTTAQSAAAPGTVPSAQPGVAVSQPGGNNGVAAEPQVQTPQQQAPAGVAAKQKPEKPAKQAPKPAPTVAQGATQDTPAPQPGAPTDPQQAAPNSNFRKSKVEKPAKNTAATGLKNKKTAAQPAAQPALKAKGGKVAGQVSQTPNAIRKRTARAAAKPAVAPMSTSGKATANFAAQPNFGQKLPAYTEEILRKIAIASTSGVPVTRDLYNAASRLMSENSTSLKQMGIKVDLSESTRHTVKLRKI